MKTGLFTVLLKLESGECKPMVTDAGQLVRSFESAIARNLKALLLGLEAGIVEDGSSYLPA